MTALMLAVEAVEPTLRRLPVPVAEPRPALRIVPDAQRLSACDRKDTPPSEAETTSTADRSGGTAHDVPPPAAAAWARQFVQAALEAAAGRRPVSQLVRWTDEDVFALLTRRASLAARLDRTGGATAGCCSVRSVRLCRPRAGVVEASAVVVDRGRYRAVALRLEDADGRWRVTALEIG